VRRLQGDPAVVEVAAADGNQLIAVCAVCEGVEEKIQVVGFLDVRVGDEVDIAEDPKCAAAAAQDGKRQRRSVVLAFVEGAAPVGEAAGEFATS